MPAPAQISKFWMAQLMVTKSAAREPNGGDVRPAPGEDQSHGVAATHRQTGRMFVVSALTSYCPMSLVIFDHPYNEYALPVDDAFAVGRGRRGLPGRDSLFFAGPCGLRRAQNHLAVACGRPAGQSMLPHGVPGPAVGAGRAGDKLGDEACLITRLEITFIYG